MRKNNRKQGRKRGEKQENWLCSIVDDYSEFERYKGAMKQLMGLVQKGASPEEIYEKFGPALAARMIMLGLTEKNPAMLKGVIQEVHNRAYGKPKEKQEVTHKYENLSEEELNQQIEQELAEVIKLKKEKGAS